MLEGRFILQPMACLSNQLIFQPHSLRQRRPTRIQEAFKQCSQKYDLNFGQSCVKPEIGLKVLVSLFQLGIFMILPISLLCRSQTLPAHNFMLDQVKKKTKNRLLLLSYSCNSSLLRLKGSHSQVRMSYQLRSMVETLITL